MPLPRIDLADPTDEGPSIADALRSRGYLVAERPLESLLEGTDAALVLLAADDPRAIDVLAALEERGGAEAGPSIILLGLPDDTGEEVTSIRPLGADAHYARPVSLERLVRKVETLLSPAETRLAPVPPLDEPAVDEPVQQKDAPPPREPTLVHSSPDDSWGFGPEDDLDDEADDASSPGLDAIFGEEAPAEVSGVAEVTGVSLRDDILSIEEALIAHDPENPVSQVARRTDSRPPTTDNAAILSPRLSKIFREADRRIFPDSPPLDLDLPDHQESARELVPDALLEVVSMPAESREEDPIEAFTYVGVVPPELVGAPLPPPEAAQRFQRQSMTVDTPLPPARPARTEAGNVSRPSRPPPTFAEADSLVSSSSAAEMAEPTQSEPTQENVEQHGSVDGVEVLRFLMSIATAATPIDARLTIDEGAEIELTVVGGRLTRIAGDVHLHALEELHRHGRVDEVPADEARAVALLDARISAGSLGRFEADRALRRAREARIHDLGSTRSLGFDVVGASTHRNDGPGLLSSSLSAALTEGARRRIDATRLHELFGGGALVIEVKQSLAEAADTLGLEPEITQAVERHDGASVDAFVAAAPAEEGLAGALLSLAALGAVEVRSRGADQTGVVDPAGAVQALIESAYALAEDGCYFDVLGASPDALPREIRAAYEARRSELSQIDLEVHGLAELAPLRREAIEVVDEAFEVLCDERLNAAYRQALGL